jgi:hypothetical protein
MRDDFGYFGSGLEGYVQFNDALKRIFDSVSPPNSFNVDSIFDTESQEETDEDNSDIDIADDDSSDDDMF